MVNPTRTAAALAIAAIASLSASDAAPHVDAGVHRALRQQGAADIIVTMKQDTRATLNSVGESSTSAGRGEKITELVNSLEALATESQKAVFDLLAQEAGDSTELYESKMSFWISNQIYFKQASPQLINKLAHVNAIQSIRPENVYPLPKIIPSQMNSTLLESTNEWGVQKINAPGVWQKGFTGEGVIVGAIDTGVRGTHEALKGNFRGDFGWFDPERKKAQPYDPNGHGSHTMGSIAGANGIGVAPGAKWMACKGCRSNGCSDSDLLTCFQFMTCPTDTSGKKKDCSKAPHLVSNSWGGGQGSDTFTAAVEAWHKAGIIPIFANGNEGPECKTASSPADLPNVIAVGATTDQDGLADFSSKGPSVNGLTKPDVSAPGQDVRSAWNSGDNAYNSISGTSMATPHVAGAVALILQVKPGTTYDQVRTLLTSTVETDALQPLDRDCGGADNAKFPNNGYGYGRINVLRAIGA